MRNVISQKIDKHSLEIMYGISNFLTLYSNLSFFKKETSYESLENELSYLLKLTGLEDD